VGLPDRRGMVEIGFAIAPAYRNRDLATEAAKAKFGIGGFYQKLDSDQDDPEHQRFSRWSLDPCRGWFRLPPTRLVNCTCTESKPLRLSLYFRQAVASNLHFRQGDDSNLRVGRLTAIESKAF
jgi:hypothetical protein